MRKELFDIPECKILWDWIYLFHMPLFIFISGYFSRKKNRKDFILSFYKIIEPLIIFQIIALIFYIRTISIANIFTPWFSLWYLLSLIYWRIILQIIPEKYLNNKKLILITAFCISMLSGFYPEKYRYFLSIQRTLYFMPYFFLGYYLKRKNLFLTDRYKPFCLAFLILIFLIPIFIPQYLHFYPYRDYYDLIKGIFVLTLGITMSLAFINLCVNTSWIAKQGRMTMQYYIYHAFIIPPFMIVVNKLYIHSSFLTAIIYTLTITIGIGIVLLYSPCIRELTNPLSYFMKQQKRGCVKK